jgi:membrane fusion protein (multidrug efflux system)
VGSPISFEVEGTEKEKFYAKIDLVYPCIDETTGTVACRAIINNPSQELHPGSLAKVEIFKL